MQLQLLEEDYLFPSPRTMSLFGTHQGRQVSARPVTQPDNSKSTANAAITTNDSASSSKSFHTARSSVSEATKTPSLASRPSKVEAEHDLLTCEVLYTLGLQSAYYIGTPNYLFQLLSKRERDRIYHQFRNKGSGRRQTLPFEHSSPDLSSENNIRAQWVEQGIWMDAWGQAWPPGEPKTRGGRPTGGPSPGMTWAHEEASSLDVKPNANREALRPIYMFLYQVLKEREWLQDEYAWRQKQLPADIYAAAFESVKRWWGKAGLWWDSKWDAMPGINWRHEGNPKPDWSDPVLQKDLTPVYEFCLE